MPYRYDVVQMKKPERTAQGFLRADAVLTRSGVFSYRNNDGSIRKEYRPPEEVFRDDSLRTFEDAPVTVDHPDRMVTKENAREFSVGTVKETPRRDGDFAIARLLVTDAKAIEEVESGRRSAVSCGYECDFDGIPGITPDGERFDGSQRNIRGNHLALVGAGRAGPEARVRLDAADAVQVESQQVSPRQQELFDMKTKTIRIDGVDHELPEHSAQIVERELKRRDDEIVALKSTVSTKTTEADREKARADGLDEKVKKITTDASPENFNKAVQERVELLGAAYAILGEEKCDELKVDTLESLAIKKAVVMAVSPEAKLEGKSVDYVAARYDQAIESFDAEPKMADVRAAALTSRADGGEVDVEKVRQESQKRGDEAWKKPLATTRAS